MLLPGNSLDAARTGASGWKLATFGRFRSPTGVTTDIAIGPERLAKAASRLPREGTLDDLLALTGKLASSQCPPYSRPVAIVALGFGVPDPIWWKGEFDESKHPRWPAGAPDGQGGQFRPKDDSGDGEDDERRARLKEQVVQQAARKEVRIKIMAALRTAALAATNIIPVVGEVDDLLLAADIALTAAEIDRLRVDAAAALAFVGHAPYTLDELRMSSQYESFPSPDAFTKDLEEKRFGRAGDGYQYHHIVGQGGDNRNSMSAEQLHNTENIVRIPTLVHEAINAKMYDTVPETNLTYRQWLPMQPYEVQREWGIKIMRDMGIIR